MKTIVHRSLAIGLLLVFPNPARAADLYIQSIKAPILSEPSLGSQKIAEGTKGEVLKEIEKKGNWYRVDYRGKTGWVSRLLIGNRPPMNKISVLEETGEKLEKGVRKRASAFTTAAAARGLAEDRARLSDKYKVDFKGLEALEAFKVSDEDALSFVHAGVGR